MPSLVRLGWLSCDEIYSFDDVGNRLSSHLSAVYDYQAGQFNRLASTATANFVYDANGNLTSKAEGSKRWSYLWDHDNRLTMAWHGKDRVRYRYDALGRRVQRIVPSRGESTKFIYDGDDVLVDDNNGVLTKYINGPGVDNKLKMTTNGTVRYFVSDHLGSTNALTDASGAIVEQTNYDSFGNATANLSTRYQFTGREFDNLTGLHYYRARWYDASVGRFISEDPIGFAGGDVNLYGYVGNKPGNFVDPFGLDEYAIADRFLNQQDPEGFRRRERKSPSETADEIQLQLGVYGMIPGVGEPFDILDGGISLIRGDYCGASLSTSSAVPFFGWGAGGLNTIRKVEKVVDGAGDVANSSANGLRLNKSLASQSQMTEAGTIMAGTGGRVPFRDSERVANQYGGDPSNWVKKTSSSYTASDGTIFETHWVENLSTGQRVEFKTKFVGGN